MLKTAVLVSGGGTNLQALIDAAGRGEMPHVQLSLVVSDRAGAFALERARKAGIRCGAGNYGLRVHEAALARGVKVTGATVHFVNEIPDGGEIIAQRAVEVRPGDTPEALQRRVMEQAEWKILPEAAEAVAERLEGESDR